MSGAILVVSGLDPTDALKAISRARGLEVPEAREQRQWLIDFANWFAMKKADPTG